MHINRSTRCGAHLAALLGATVSLLLLLLHSLSGYAAQASANGNFLRVPDDFATIQAAIDAAQAGDEIRIQGGPDPNSPATYFERLTITKAITLSGGWSADFSQQSAGGYPTIVDAQGLGRAISVTTANSTTVVAIEALIVTGGDATGLGGWQAITALPGLSPDYGNPGVPPTDTLRLADILPASVPEEVRVRQAKLAERLAQWSVLSDRAPAVPAHRQAEAQADVVDCGGGIYSAQASLRLSQVYVAYNQASRTGDGYGGGVCIVTAPPGGVTLVNTTIAQNVGADQGDNYGGGLFIADAPGAILTDNEIAQNLGTTGGKGAGGGAYIASDQATLTGNRINQNVAAIVDQGAGGGLMLQAVAGTVISNSIQSNLASAGALGLGGGLMIIGSDGVQVIGNFVGDNLASSAGTGVGGGLHIADADNVQVERNTFSENTGGSGLTTSSMGGGVYARAANAIVFADNLFERNLGSLYQSGLGGGLYLYRLSDARVQDNQFNKNWGAIYARNGAGGGGLGLGEATGLMITGNTFAENVAALYTGGMASGYGGGIYAVVLQDSLIATNTFTANSGSWAGQGKGGGLSTSPDIHDNNTERLVVADNLWQGNVATAGTSPGRGGAIELRAVDSQVVRNRFADNHGCAEAACSKGGTVYVHGWRLCRDITLDRNVILGNLTPAGMSRDDSLLRVEFVDAYTVTNNVLVDAAAESGVMMFTVGTTLDPDSSSQSWVVNNTVVGGQNGPGITVIAGLAKDSLTIINNIVVSHTVGITVSEDSDAQTLLSYNLFDGNGLNVGGAGVYTHTHPVIGPPAFRNAAEQDYRLTVSSAARDAGDPAGVPPAPDHDEDGNSRPFGPRVDIGAYEWHGPQIFLPLITRQTTVRVGWAVGNGDDGLPGIIHTTDGGRTWTRQATPVTTLGLDAGDISAVDDLTAWAAFAANPGVTFPYILHTRDGGATWITQTLPAGAGQGVKSVKALSRDEAWAATLDGVILHTTDGGAMWTVVPHPGVAITQVNRMDVIPPHIWIADAAEHGAIIHSTDGGATWRREVMTNQGRDESPLTVHAFSYDVVWASGTKSLSFFRTVDGGDTWEKVITVGGLDHLDDICGSSAADVWGAQNGDGVNGSVHRVHAPVGGEVEHTIVTPPGMFGYTPGGLSCVDNRTAWAVAPKGVPPDPSKPTAAIALTTDGETWTQAVAPADIRYWKISMVGARR
ncbi:MAG TPA: hypothetical protein GYA08_16430 [Chloroflexi bacterium]|nr:hypothetical protein [Chloroflexota bacterium]